MFVLLNPKVKPTQPDEMFQLLEDFRLPRSCKTVILNLKNNSDSIKTNCYENLVVYDDLHLLADYENLTVTDDKVVAIDVDEKTVDERDVDLNDINEAVWYNSGIFVRGFKDVLVKGKSIWNC